MEKKGKREKARGEDDEAEFCTRFADRFAHRLLYRLAYRGPCRSTHRLPESNTAVNILQQQQTHGDLDRCLYSVHYRKVPLEPIETRQPQFPNHPVTAHQETREPHRPELKVPLRQSPNVSLEMLRHIIVVIPLVA